MEFLNNLFQPNAPLKVIQVPGAEVDGALHVVEENLGEVHQPEDIEVQENYAYARAYQEREAAVYMEAAKLIAEEGNNCNETLTEITTIQGTIPSEIHRLHQEQSREVFEKFNFVSRRSQELTIDSYREHILNMLSINEVLIIEGPTGCGKTTQVPQFILDDCRNKNQLCNIVVTQPRRIAAITVAHRVCEERNWGLGSVCGYQVGLERNTSSDTILNYVTTGVLLQKLIKQKSLNEFTHIIIDEVHERNQEMDFLLLVVRKFLYLQPSSVKIILMSATFDTDEFANYFRNFSGMETIPAPIISIQKPGIYTTTIHYVDQLKRYIAMADFSIAKPGIDDATYESFIFIVGALDVVEKKKLTQQGQERKVGSVLVFLPGIYEIEEAYRRLNLRANDPTRKDDDSEFKSKWEILPLHSTITVEEQKKVFVPPKPGIRKIILATNIAESSITVPDIDYVIDFCLSKILVVDPVTKYQSLLLQWASHVNCTQRAGRVGRLADGKVYRMVPKEFYENEIPANIPPEILRAPLDRLVLNAKMLAFDEPPEAILSLALNPPDLKNIESTIWNLKECGALTVKCKGKVTGLDGDITFLGVVMAHLPLDAMLSKLIILGHMFSCLRDTIIMAAGCSLHKIFSTPFQERLKAYSNKLMWADGSCSDLIALLNLYNVWEQNKRRNAFAVGTGERGWIKQNYLSARALAEWKTLIKEITERLNRLGIKETVGQNKVTLTSLQLPLVLKVVMCGAFYPNYFIRSANAGQVDEREAVKILSGKDPYRTVYMNNMRRDQPGQLYVNNIKKYYNCETDLSVAFDKSEKVFIQFPMDRTLSTVQLGDQSAIVGIPGKVSQEVYKAVRRRQLAINCIIPALPVKEAWNRVAKLEQKQKLTSKEKCCLDNDERSVIPQLDQQYIQIHITETIDAGHFWAQNVDEMTKQNLFFLENVLNNTNNKLWEIEESERIKVGHLYSAKYDADGKFYRCKVLHIKPGRKPSAQVLFVDYGNTQTVDIEHLRSLPEAAQIKPAQAMECVLANVQPSLIKNPKGLWSDQATQIFVEKTEGFVLCAKVYSVVNSVVHLELYKSQQRRNVTLNQWLIDQGYAQPCEESYLSKENHEKREMYARSENFSTIVEEDDIEENTYDLEAPDVTECNDKIHLKGPFSPLEMRVYGITNSSISKSVKIENVSVNTVLLDAEPQDPHTRLVVASHIGQNPEGTSIVLRNTTVMPNIHGFATLMSLIFCPKMEPKPLPDGSRLAALLCGLGAYEGSSKALYAPHDFVMQLDTELDVNELSMINELRYWMNETVETMSSLYHNIIKPRNPIENCQIELRKRLFNLLKIKRKSVERTTVRFANVWNKSLYVADILESTFVNDSTAEIWPVHWTIRLNQVDELQQKLKKNLLDLRNTAQRVMDFYPGMRCELCDYSFVILPELRLHIISEAHKNNVIKNGISLD